MPGVIMEGINNELDNSHIKENLSLTKSPMATMSSQSEAIDLPAENRVDTSIEQLYGNVCEMESYGDGSPSQESYVSDGEESRIDSELCRLVRVEMNILKSEMRSKVQSPSKSSVSSKNTKRVDRLELELDASAKTRSKNKVSPEKSDSIVSKQKNSSPVEAKLQNGNENPLEAGFDKGDNGHLLLKQARELMSSGNPRRALRYALRAWKAFEKCACGKPSLNLVMSLHVTAAIYCKLRQYGQAIPVLEQSLEIPVLEQGQEHALAKFSGYMQLGDTYAMLGQLENSLQCYTTGLEIQKQTLGDMDPRVGETCRYLAEAHVQALKFDEAERFCQMALNIHRENGAPSSLEETADRRLMGLICNTKGDHEAALEHLVLASMAMVSNGQERDVVMRAYSNSQGRRRSLEGNIKKKKD